MDELQAKRMGAAKDVATIEEAIKNPLVFNYNKKVVHLMVDQKQCLQEIL